MTAIPAGGPAAILEGLGVSVPTRVVANDELAQTLDTSDEWIRTRTGIRERRVADDDVTGVALGVEAGARALKSAGGGDVDVVVLATMTPDRIAPAGAPEIAARIGVGGVCAFDVGAGCSGFVYALATAAAMITSGMAGRALVVGAEVMYRFMDPAERSTKVLFGDGAGAVVLRLGTADEPGAVGPFDLGSDGRLSELLVIPAGGARVPASAQTVARGEHFMRMDGKEVYRNAVTRMTASSRTVLERAGLTADDVDRFVGHQANVRILDAVADRLGVPADRRIVNVDRYGNTSAASIPLALADANLQAGQRILLTAFGAGVTWGSTLLTWPKLEPLETPIASTKTRSA